MVTKEWLCSPVPSTSSSLPHKHTATGNKTVTYDFAPIISREGCLDFPLEQRKEAKTINVSLVQSWAWAPLGLGSACPLSLWNILYLPNSSAPMWWWPWRFFLGPSQSQGRRNVDHPKVSLPPTQWDLPGRADRYFHSATTSRCENPNALKLCLNFSGFRQKWSQFQVSGGRNVLLSPHLLWLQSTMTSGFTKGSFSSVSGLGQLTQSWKILLGWGNLWEHRAQELLCTWQGVCSVLWKDSWLSTPCNTAQGRGDVLFVTHSN